MSGRGDTFSCSYIAADCGEDEKQQVLIIFQPPDLNVSGSKLYSGKRNSS
jgi:hypothetical protein